MSVIRDPLSVTRDWFLKARVVYMRSINRVTNHELRVTYHGVTDYAFEILLYSHAKISAAIKPSTKANTAPRIKPPAVGASQPR